MNWRFAARVTGWLASAASHLVVLTAALAIALVVSTVVAVRESQRLDDLLNGRIDANQERVDAQGHTVGDLEREIQELLARSPVPGPPGQTGPRGPAGPTGAPGAPGVTKVIVVIVQPSPSPSPHGLPLPSPTSPPKGGSR